jgi:hypothetical protein
MLDAVPDLRQTLKTANDDELAEIFRAFDVRITYDKTRQVLDLAATITPELCQPYPTKATASRSGRRRSSPRVSSR